MAKLARLISSIQRQTEATETENPISYRLWVDTLCCPVELSGKMTALQRLADVYRNAKHVLVLDSALTKFSSESTHPAELLMRTFGASPWMRRLWTLQGIASTLALESTLLTGHVQQKDPLPGVSMFSSQTKPSIASH